MDRRDPTARQPEFFGITRRGFLVGAAAGVPLGWLALRGLPFIERVLGFVPPERSTQKAGGASLSAMPGPYPGRVVEARHPLAVSPDNAVDPAAVSAMVDRGMAGLVGGEPNDVAGNWKRLFGKGDVVGIKVNPVGRKPQAQDGWTPGAVGAISSFPLVAKVVACLKRAGVRARDIIVFDRYANEFCKAGYARLVERELPGVRWMAAAASYTNDQLDIRGFDPGCERLSPEVSRRVAGYDPDVFTSMGFCQPAHSARDDRRFRSHLASIVSRTIDKMVTLPVLKDHRSAGVTLALKNMSHGMNNNVARSHLAGIAHGFGAGGTVMGPNQCNTFIPQCVAQKRLRDKATLHILDGLIGVYEGGPGAWNSTWGTWRHQGLFFATDPVALDHVCWDIIDKKRAGLGWAPVARMGWLYQNEATPAASASAILAGQAPLAAATLAPAIRMMLAGRASESFNRRQPEHIVLAGQLRLGVFAREQITYISI